MNIYLQGYSAIFGSLRDIASKRVDLPALGNLWERIEEAIIIKFKILKD